MESMPSILRESCFADSPGNISDAIKLADQVFNEHINTDLIPVPLSKILAAAKTLAKKYYGLDEVSFEFKRIHVEPPYDKVKGLLLRDFESERVLRSRIYYIESLNFCWARFVITKELSHLIGDSIPAFFTSSIALLAKEITSPHHWQIRNVLEPLSPEVFAAIIAIEIMFPQRHWTKVQALLANGDLNTYQIAEQFKIPQFYVRLKLEDDHFKKLFVDGYISPEVISQ